MIILESTQFFSTCCGKERRGQVDGEVGVRTGVTEKKVELEECMGRWEILRIAAYTTHSS